MLDQPQAGKGQTMIKMAALVWRVLGKLLVTRVG